MSLIVSRSSSSLQESWRTEWQIIFRRQIHRDTDTSICLPELWVSFLFIGMSKTVLTRPTGSLNGARGSLRVKLLKGVFDPIDWFIHRRCSCKELSSFAYITGLSKMKIWPIESASKKSIQEILDSFDKFVCIIPEKACLSCRTHLNSIAIKRIRNEIQSSFHGLCLDCMYKSSEGSDMAFVYYQRDLEKNYDMDCRIYHGQSSWYWSNMGKKEDMQAHQERKKRAYENRRFGF